MTTTTHPNGLIGREDVNSGRLFLGSCFALISTAVAFGVVTSFLDQIKTAFSLNNEQAGWIGGAAIWGFTIPIFILGPLCDALGMRFLMRFAFVCHVCGVLVMVTAHGFIALFTGALLISMGNGTVEAACNPLVTTIFPDRKTEKLNKFHVWFPGGIVIGGLIAFFIDKAIPTGTLAGLAPWQLKLLVILIPTIIYAFLFIGQKFPHTERVQSGVSFGSMVKETLTRPLFMVLFFCMMITASLELGPGRWMDTAMRGAMKFAGENAGILVLVYGSLLMAILRFKAGAFVHRLSPTGLLVCSAILGGSGLFLLTWAHSGAMVFIAATMFYVGVCYFWPTMLGVAAERVPKGGALALGILGGTGMAVVGLVTVPLMGLLADRTVQRQLPLEDTRAILSQVVETYPALQLSASDDAKKAISTAVDSARKLTSAGAELPRKEAATADREAVKAAPESEAGKKAQSVIAKVDEAGTLVGFRTVASFAIVLVLVFGILFLRDKAHGGYKPEHIGA